MVLRFLLGDPGQFCPKHNFIFIFIATEFAGHGFEPLDLGEFLQRVRLGIRAGGTTGWHGRGLVQVVEGQHPESERE